MKREKQRGRKKDHSPPRPGLKRDRQVRKRPLCARLSSALAKSCSSLPSAVGRMNERGDATVANKSPVKKGAAAVLVGASGNKSARRFCEYFPVVKARQASRLRARPTTVRAAFAPNKV